MHLRVFDKVPASRIRQVQFVLGVILWGAALLALAADNRQAWSGNTFPWLAAIGKLQVPGSRYQDGRRKHYLEDCSATLIAPANSHRADTIVTAWHCLEFYHDLTRPILFTLQTGSGESISRTAHPLADGGGMHADWALLRLYQAVPSLQVTALQTDTRQADAGRPVIMAGYSRDNGPGHSGEALSFDPACRITHQGRTVSATNCTAYKGSSGGPVLQLTTQGKPYVYGIISEGNGAGYSTFVPVHGFRNAIELYLN